MSKTNCINCGAAKDTSEIKCPFCGTTYLDMTSIDFASGDPVVCQFILPGCGDGRMIMSMLAVPQLNEISVEHEYTSFYGDVHHTPLATVCTGTDMRLGVEFRPVVMHDKKDIYEIRLEE